MTDQIRLVCGSSALCRERSYADDGKRRESEGSKAECGQFHGHGESCDVVLVGSRNKSSTVNGIVHAMDVESLVVS